MKANAPAMVLVPSESEQGYTIYCADGGAFPFGDAKAIGTLGATKLNQPIMDVKMTKSGKGGWMLGKDGGVFPFGDAGGFGSIPGLPG